MKLLQGDCLELMKSIPDHSIDLIVTDPDFKYPEDVLQFPAVVGNSKERTKHPTQKSVTLLEYLVKTYSNIGDTVLDCFMGSGTTGVACMNTGRDFIGIELNKEYFDIAKRRIEESQQNLFASQTLQK